MKFSLLAILLLACVESSAQDTGLLTGTVRDKTGAVIPSATVVISDTSRGFQRSTSTNAEGSFVIAGLPADSYDVSIAARGFEQYQNHDVVLHSAQRRRIDIILQVAETATEIMVPAKAVAQVETESSELAGTITGKEIMQLELNGRNFTQLITLVPGISNQTGQDEALVGVYGNVNYSINGGRVEYNNWEFDGGDSLDNGSNSTLNVYPSIEAISEVRVLTSNYGAQYGRNGSGTVEVETKSGTSTFHGDVYEFLRNDMFNARNYFDDPTQHKPAYKKNDFGYTLGGPIYIPGIYDTHKDETYFFWSQEWRRENIPGSPFDVQVPSNAERMGNFGDVCPPLGTAFSSAVASNYPDCPIDNSSGAPNWFKTYQVPIDPNARDLMMLIPQSNLGAGTSSFFKASPSQPTKWREELLRIDHNVTSNIRATFRYIHDSWDTLTPTTIWASADFPTIRTHLVDPGVSIVARLTASTSPSLLNEFVMSYTTDHISLTNQGLWQHPANMTMGSLFNNGFGGKIAGFAIMGGAPYNGGFSEDAAFIPWSNSNPTYTLRDNITKSISTHNLQFGVYAVAAQKNEMSSEEVQGFLTFANFSPVSTGNAWADMLLGRIATYAQANLQPKYYNRYKIVEPYFQDDWRVNAHLTLNLGLRLSLFGTYRDRYKTTWNFVPSEYSHSRAPLIDTTGSITGQQGALVPNIGNPFDGLVHCGVPGQPIGCMTGHLFNPAPRIGFAFDPGSTGKTAIRGAYGIFFEHTNGNEANTESLEGSPPLVLNPTQFNIVGYSNIGGNGLLFPLRLTAIPTHAIWPYVQQWHIDVQHELIRHTVATLSYVGTKGTHLTLQRDLNQIPALPVSADPYLPGEPIGPNDCGTMTTPTGVPIRAQAAINLSVACGNDPNPYRPFSGFGTIALLEDQANSNYNALQASLRRTLGSLVLNVAYTYSHSIDNASDRYDASFIDSYNLHSDRASSNFDQRHLLNISYVYDLPFFRASGIPHNLFGGWQVSGITTFQTGTPFSVINSAYFPDNAGVGNGAGPGTYPDLVGNPNSPPPVQFVDGITGPLLYNPNAFAAPRGLTFGDAGRNILRIPPRTNFDAGIFKHFRTSESTAVEFRTEAFNVLNHTQWASINNSISCYGPANNLAGDQNCLAVNSFLHPSSAHRGRTLQLAMKFIF